MGSGKGREKKVTKRARQSSTSCSETPPVYCKSRKASVIKSGLEKCRTATAAASPSNPLLRIRFHSGQGGLQPENAAAQFGGGFFLPPWYIWLWENITDYKNTSLCRTPDGTLAGDEAETGNLQVIPLPSKQWDVMGDVLGEPSVQATEIKACSCSISVKHSLSFSTACREKK